MAALRIVVGNYNGSISRGDIHLSGTSTPNYSTSSSHVNDISFPAPPFSRHLCVDTRPDLDNRIKLLRSAPMVPTELQPSSSKSRKAQVGVRVFTMLIP